MTTRRHLTVALVALLLCSGCLGFVTGQRSLTFEAKPAVVGGSVAHDAGYRSNGTRTASINRSFQVAGQSRTITVDNRVTTYQKAVELGPLGSAKLGVFTVISTPAVKLGDRTFNPIGDYDNDKLVRLIQSQYGGLSDVKRVEDRNVTVLGTSTRVTKYGATASVDGKQIDVYVHVTKVRDGDDFVVAVGLYPRALGGEGKHVLAMMRAIEHPA